MKRLLNDLEIIKKYRNGAVPDHMEVDSVERLMLLGLLEVSEENKIKSTRKGIRLLRLA